MLAGIRRRSGPKVFQLSLIPPSLLPQRESRAPLSPIPVILAEAGIQSLFCPPLPSFSPQRESRALLSPTPVILAAAGIQAPFVPYSRHSRRSGNPGPFRPLLPSFSPQRESRALLSPTPVILAAAGIQSPFVPYSRHSRRSGNPEPFCPPLPSFSPQRESRALFVCSEGCADMGTPGVGRPPPSDPRCGENDGGHLKGLGSDTLPGFPGASDWRSWV